MSLILPSYQSGFAPRDYEPAYPSLWQGCVAAYAPLLGPTGLVLKDSVGKNDGVLTNGPTWDISGGRYALGFDGSNDVARSSTAVPTYPFCISAWCSPRTLHTGYPVAFASSIRNGPIFGLQVSSGGNFIFHAEDEVTGQQLITSTSTYSAGNWYHVVLIARSATSRELYVSGIQEGTNVNSIVIDSRIDRFSIGSFDRQTPAGFFNGNVDDVRRYNRVLQPSEIRLLSTRRGIAYEPRPRRKWYFRGFSPKKKLLEAKITSTIPGSYQTGYAPRDGEPVYPELWKNCVGAWSAGLGPSNILRDNSPGKNDGTLVNGPTYQVSGGQYAINMDGTDDYVSAAQSVSLTDGVVTVSGWMRRTGTPDQNNAVVFAKGTLEGNASSTCALYWNEIQGWSWFVVDASNNLTIVRSNTVTTLNQWVHVCGVASSAGLRLYLNGVLANSTTGASLKNSTQQSTLGGASVGAIFTSLRGQLDDVRVYNKALSESEIKTLATRRNIAYEYKRPRTLFRAYDPIKQVGVGKITSIIPGGYHTGVGGLNNEPAYPELTKGLVGGWCPSLGVTGGVLRDNSGQGNHGTLTNGPTWQISGGKYALDFDGVDDYVDAGTNIPLGGLTHVSFSAWVWRATQGAMFALARYNTSLGAQTRGDYFGINNFTANGQVSLAITSAGDGLSYLGFYSTEQIVASQWNHIAASCVIAGNNSTCKLFLNGKACAVNTDHGGTRPTSWGANNAVPYTIARVITGGGSGVFTSGIIDDVRAYNRLLSDNEIRLLASRRGIGYDYKSHRSYSKTQSSGLRRRILTGLP